MLSEPQQLHQWGDKGGKSEAEQGYLEKQKPFFWEQSISARQHMCLAAHLGRQASPADPL